MPRPPFPTTFFEFQSRFPDESSCAKFLIESRWPDGFKCPKCGNGREFYWIEKRKQMQCHDCRHQTSITAGTVLHHTQQPLRTWFLAAYLMTTQTPGESAVQFQRQAGISYETAFMLMHKLRAAMVRTDREKLRGVVEVDETLIGGAAPDEGGRSHGGKKALVVGAVEVRDRYAGRIRLQVIPDASRSSLEGFIRGNIESGSQIRTDAWASYKELGRLGYEYVRQVEGKPERAAIILPHVHRVFANLKTWLLGTHHGRVSHQHLQAYLNEFTFRYNRRKTPMAAFQTLLGLVEERRGPTYEGLYGVAKGETEWIHPNPLKTGDAGEDLPEYVWEYLTKPTGAERVK